MSDLLRLHWSILRVCAARGTSGRKGVQKSIIDCPQRMLGSHNNAKQTVNKTRFYCLVNMDDNGCRCCVFLIVIVCAAIGLPCAYFGDKCKSAELRAEHKNDTCKHIHNDDSAKALLGIGFILSLPLQIAFLACMCYCAFFCLQGICEESNSVAPASNNDGGGFILAAFVGFSD